MCTSCVLIRQSRGIISHISRSGENMILSNHVDCIHAHERANFALNGSFASSGRRVKHKQRFHRHLHLRGNKCLNTRSAPWLAQTYTQANVAKSRLSAHFVFLRRGGDSKERCNYLVTCLYFVRILLSKRIKHRGRQNVFIQIVVCNSHASSVVAGGNPD